MVENVFYINIKLTEQDFYDEKFVCEEGNLCVIYPERFSMLVKYDFYSLRC
jgi:hypothetical protein